MKTLLFIPTYNERENVQRTYALIKEQHLDLDLLFLDDNSPDGTGQLLDEMASRDARMRVIHRSGKLGIGSAHQHAIQWAYDQGYPVVVSMDCDLTHPPHHLPTFLQYAGDYEIVLGSRFMQEESLSEWNLLRKFLTHLGHFLTRHVLHVPYDATGAFRLYRLDRIHRDVFRLVESTGYAFFFESLYILCLSGVRVKEIPIELPIRTHGQSKMRITDVLASLQRLVKLYRRSFRIRDDLRKLGAAPITSEKIATP
ncbi:MAG TPA: glycosyltransferase [Verrucomicrobiae bacterium]|nr:glycosyltransferase [Verrucomicrobiae bacterium]